MGNANFRNIPAGKLIKDTCNIPAEERTERNQRERVTLLRYAKDSVLQHSRQTETGIVCHIEYE